ncbi:hypothetical protein A3Q34_01145 [Colwellia sp. PAMC 20917]|nr:hypothetical protein A3Q34_01145 [Colwellia sp. PAMC 20917]
MNNLKKKLVWIGVILTIWAGSLRIVYEAGEYDGWNDAVSYESCDVARRITFFGQLYIVDRIF